MTSSESPPNGKATGTHSVQVYQVQAAQIRASPGNLCSTKQPLESGPMFRCTAWVSKTWKRKWKLLYRTIWGGNLSPASVICPNEWVWARSRSGLRMPAASLPNSRGKQRTSLDGKLKGSGTSVAVLISPPRERLWLRKEKEEMRYEQLARVSHKDWPGEHLIRGENASLWRHSAAVMCAEKGSQNLGDTDRKVSKSRRHGV